MNRKTFLKTLGLTGAAVVILPRDIINPAAPVETPGNEAQRPDSVKIEPPVMNAPGNYGFGALFQGENQVFRFGSWEMIFSRPEITRFHKILMPEIVTIKGAGEITTKLPPLDWIFAPTTFVLINQANRAFYAGSCIIKGIEFETEGQYYRAAPGIELIVSGEVSMLIN